MNAIDAATFYVLGGRQPLDTERLNRPEWALYDQAVILHVNPGTQEVRKVVEYVSRPDSCPWDQEPSILFKSSTRIGDRLYTCTSTEVLVYALPSFARIAYVSHPYFNDLHHVAVNADGQLVVVDTGLDMVLVMDLDGTVHDEFSVNEDPLWTRFSRKVDYRKVLTTKPHKSHPNHAFFLGSELWVTRCEQKDAICLTRPNGRFDIEFQFPHDGVAAHGNVYFTTVDGHICIFDAQSRRIKKIVDLNRISGRDDPLGWCRGLCLVTETIALVGFTRLRRTKFKEKVAWVKSRLGMSSTSLTTAPTRIAAYDLETQRLLVELDLEQHELNAIFGVHPA